MAQSEFPLPDVGEGLTEAEIVSWKVKPGDSVAVNQVLVEIETAKSLVELPSPFAGTVTALLAEEGATVEVGAPIIRVDSAGGSIELQAPGNEGDALGTIADTATTTGRGAVEEAVAEESAPSWSATVPPAVTPPPAVADPRRWHRRRSRTRRPPSTSARRRCPRHPPHR